MRSGIVLIGMPGAGKSTIGVLLAKELGLGFIDTDLLIQMRERRSLQEILDAEGYLRLREIEAQVLLEIDADAQVVATGGSAVYSEAAMHHLARRAKLVYLDVPLAVLEARIHNHATRGIAKAPEQSFAELLAERSVLYQRYADLRIDCDNLSPAQIVALLIEQLKRRNPPR